MDYSENEDPLYWKDTDEQDEEDKSLFKTADVEGTMAFGTISDQSNIHSHYCDPGVLNWTNYIYTGRMYMTKKYSGIGVTFLSRFPESKKIYYRLMRHGGKRSFQIEPHPAGDQVIKGIVDSGVEPQKNTWYCFRIEVEDIGIRTNIKAKIWQEGSPEPDDYQIDAYDDSPFRLSYGTVGLWTTGAGYKYFDDLKVIGTGAATYNWAFRNLFVDNKPREALGNKNLFLPGTLLTLCFVKNVHIMPGKSSDPTYTWKRKLTEKPPINISSKEIKNLLGTGHLSLLLLQANPSQWLKDENHLPEFTCLDGEISLDLFEPEGSAQEKIYQALNLEPADPGPRSGAVALLGALSVHSSGLTIYGKAMLPWEEDRIAAPFQLARLLYDPAIPSSENRHLRFRLTIELERLMDFEKISLKKAWQNLSNFLNPHHPLNTLEEPPETPTWVTLEIVDPRGLPRIYWQIMDWQEEPGVLPLHFERGQINLLLSDQQPYDEERPASSIARIIPDDISIQPGENGELQISIEATQAAARPKILLFEDFDDYSQNEDPLNWKDTGADYSFEEDTSLFKTTEVEGKMAFGTSSQLTSIHSHYNAPGVLDWTNYIFTGRMYINNQNRGIGVTFFSHYPENQDRYYILTRYDANRTFHIEVRPDEDQQIRGTIDSGVNPERKTWYRFYIEVEDSGSQTNIRAKIWKDGEPEPSDFQIDAYDDSANRILSGTVGLYTEGHGAKYFDDLKVASIPERVEVTERLLQYNANQENDSKWQEDFMLSGLDVAFSPVETPRLLRNNQELTTPEWSPGEEPEPVKPSVLWGFMPLEDGWAQLPIPNLTEQIYLDARLVRFKPPSSQPSTSLLQGAVDYGNSKVQVLEAHSSEQPWSVTLFNALHLSGVWTLNRDPNSADYKLNSVHIQVASPEIMINGLFWLSTGKPTMGDALPNFDNWISGLQNIPLKTIKPDVDLFPAPLILTINKLSFSLRPEQQIQSGELPSALLKELSFLYAVDIEVIKKMVQIGILSADTFSKRLPLIWRGHPSLPMIQVLPLTQSKSPPNHPNTSRQLVPFELATVAKTVELEDGKYIEIAIPSNWQFDLTGENGATCWLRLLVGAQPAREWKALYDLSLASLSLPGLVLDPNALPEITGLTLPPTNLLPIQYRFDLPYTDEINALAQLPKVARIPEEASPLPDSPPPEPPKPLTRETLFEHWQRLAERANLASADAIAAFIKQNNQTAIQGLIEPFLWSVIPEFELEMYPGALTLENSNHIESGKMVLKAETALKGVSGKFISEGNGQIKRVEGLEDNPYILEAGSMAAYRGGNGKFRDQRGLQREASISTTKLVKTKVMLDGENNEFEITSSLFPFELNMPGSSGWQFWFRDLPVKSGTFERDSVLSSEVEDVNDPEAHSRERNYLAGYEWRLADRTASSNNFEFLLIFNLHFYPLTLEKIVFRNDDIEKLEIIGRLQLPHSNGSELEEFSNAVRITFEYDDILKQLKFVAIDLESEVAEWPLALQGGEADESPRLFWKKISLTKDAIDIDDILLNFFLFGKEWSIQLEKLSVPQDKTEISQTYTFPQVDPPEALAPRQLDLSIDLKNFKHAVSFVLLIKLGNLKRATFEAEVKFQILGEKPGAVIWQSGFLFEDMNLLPQTTLENDLPILFTENALQFKWQNYEIAENINLQLLPGMHLQSNNAPGFVTLTFDVIKDGEDVPKLQLTTSFVEAILFCRWGQFLQAIGIPENPELSQVFGSSAGDLAFGYTAQWSDDSWDESYLLNGFLEVKNLISWPKEMAYDENNSTLTLPAARATVGAEQPALDHLRHTIRILFNQHQIPEDLLIVVEEKTEETEKLLFNLVPDKSWQFLAVVEHQLIDVFPQDLESEPEAIKVNSDRRWTALQEVRLVFPETFKNFLSSLKTDKIRTIAPVKEIDWIGEVNYGYLGTGLRDMIIEKLSELIKKIEQDDQYRTLLVEASAPHWIKQTPIAGAESVTTLQFLPNGNQLGVVSSPQDYESSDPSNPKWLLFTTPFLGRLQHQANDFLEMQETGADSVSEFLVDPILWIHRNRGLSPEKPLASIPLAFSNWADDNSVDIIVSSFDSSMGRIFPRLDPISLEENWFRLQNPLPEPQPEGLQSVMATLPDTPARLSRATALRRAFDTFRRVYPPAPLTMTDYDLLPLEQTGQIVWRQNSIMLMQGVSSIDVNDDPPYGWHLVGLQILSSEEYSKSFNGRQRYAAATVLPALLEIDGKENRIPLSFAVSPYLGLDFKPSGSSLELRLVSAELLCIDRVSGTLLPAASHFWELKKHDEDFLTPGLKWAKEIHHRLCPDSPIAILRFREIRENLNEETEIEAPLTTTYSFAIVSNIRKREQLVRRVFRIRSSVSELRFREGQFGGDKMPENIRPFEIAPPQVIGVQPVYLTERPITNTSNSWHWGLSSLRMSVQYLIQKKSAIGYSSNDSTENNSLTLWWQAPQHFVQYRSALHSKLPTAGLPSKFRAPAIKSFLPVIPNPHLPLFNILDLVPYPKAGNREHTIQNWQPVLPGTLRYLLLGARPGVMFAVRHQLLRQSSLVFEEDDLQVGEIMVSGSIPVQHRMPRPVPLPENKKEETEFALQTWASYFEPDQNSLVNESPVDEAFFAECGGAPARRLQMKLMQPVYGAIGSRWDSNFVFEINFEKDAHTQTINDWEITLAVIDDGETFEYEPPTPDNEKAYRFKLSEEKLVTLKERLNNKVAGDILMASAKVKHTTAADGFFQTLVFPLRISDETALPLPLKPYFIHFEDPEYNRQLASSSAHASGIVKVLDAESNPEVHTVTLSADRREYNYDSKVAIRYDWDDNRSGSAKLELLRLDSSGITKKLDLIDESGSSVPLDNVEPGKLMQFSLLNLKYEGNTVLLNPGDALQFKLTIKTDQDYFIFLKVNIVEEPVIPVPESAYALLRRRKTNDAMQVECVKFAWGPEANRIELVCAEDLRTEVVRRRAVFQWTDSMRPQMLKDYAIQKITSTGSTHFPLESLSEGKSL
ncbi:MAG: hypothetical protein JSW07_13960 [bacterium]|nr:MAG: hypothetical protein JSW07_13960 [bacterium]